MCSNIVTLSYMCHFLRGSNISKPLLLYLGKSWVLLCSLWWLKTETKHFNQILVSAISSSSQQVVSNNFTFLLLQFLLLIIGNSLSKLVLYMHTLISVPLSPFLSLYLSRSLSTFLSVCLCYLISWILLQALILFSYANVSFENRRPSFKLC